MDGAHAIVRSCSRQKWNQQQHLAALTNYMKKSSCNGPQPRTDRNDDWSNNYESNEATKPTPLTLITMEYSFPPRFNTFFSSVLVYLVAASPLTSASFWRSFRHSWHFHNHYIQRLRCNHELIFIGMSAWRAPECDESKSVALLMHQQNQIKYDDSVRAQNGVQLILFHLFLRRPHLSRLLMQFIQLRVSIWQEPTKQ